MDDRTSRARGILLRNLADADRRVAEGELLVARQRNTVDVRRRGNLDLELPMKLLGVLEETQILHVENRDRVLRELAGIVSPLPDAP